MASKIIIALCVMLAVVAAVPQPGGTGAQAAGGWGPPAAGGWGAQAAWGPAAGANPWIPSWIASAPWMPQWVPCAAIGSDCLDCTTKVVCTKVGGIQKACSDPLLPYCNLGQCSATPSAECAPVAPATAGAA